jgi:hypothetical protein
VLHAERGRNTRVIDLPQTTGEVLSRRVVVRVLDYFHLSPAVL